MSHFKIYNIHTHLMGNVGFGIVGLVPKNDKHPRIEVYLSVGDFHKELLLDIEAASFKNAPVELTEEFMWREGEQQLRCFYLDFLEGIETPSIRASMMSRVEIVEETENGLELLLRHHLRGKAASLPTIQNRTNCEGLAEVLNTVLGVAPMSRREI